ncbi:hypothetical protein C0216_33195 (plasmid) [Streptomyces globosus]|uniref:Uncharacterized protein n=1 Tax=Streptomyces globosus TaxID=68209 RepID=A0A344UBN4_9ACTN|nr:hypothetical protein [Streptomyces globosus]AXE28305.1 hypothetical protein C0216_33195 [Streptomyces globosus]
MPYLIPTRTPLTPEQVEQGFDYLLALQTCRVNHPPGVPPVLPSLTLIAMHHCIRSWSLHQLTPFYLHLHAQQIDHIVNAT